MKAKLEAISQFVYRTVPRLVRGTWVQMRDSDVPILAGSLSYSTVLSLVPLLAVSLSVFKAFGGFDSLFRRIEPFILRNFVEVSGAHVSQFIEESVTRIHSGALGTAGAIALFLTSTNLFLNVERAVQRVWREKAPRYVLRRLLVYWFLMFASPLVLAATIGVIGSKDLGLLPLLPHHTISFACTLVAFVIINKFLPARSVSWRSAFIASLVAAIGIVLAQSFYAQITRQILRSSKIYGSIASIPIFFLWISVLWWICLGGVAFCATLEKLDEPLMEPSTEPSALPTSGELREP